MKFFAFAFLVLSAAVVSDALSIRSFYGDSSDLINNLLIQAEKLKKLIEDEVAKLEAEGKSALGKGLEEIEKVILDVEGQLKNLNPNSLIDKALLNVLEGLLEKAEKDIEAEVKKITGSFYGDTSDLINNLLIQAEKLKKLIEDEVAKLEAEGKSVLGKGLEEIEKVILDVEGQLKNLNPNSLIDKALLNVLEGLLEKAEKEIEAEVKKITGSLYGDSSDLINNLLIQAEKLKKLIEDEVAKLEAEGKSVLGKGLEEIEKVILDVEGQLKNLNPNSLIDKALLNVLEGLLEKAEKEIEAEVKKITGSF